MTGAVAGKAAGNANPYLPRGTVTFLFSDIEGSTRLLEALGDRYAGVLADVRRLTREALAESGGSEVDTQGDALFAAFPGPRTRPSPPPPTASGRWLGIRGRTRSPCGCGWGCTPASRRWPPPAMSAWTSITVLRICSAAHGGQVLLSWRTAELVAVDLPAGVTLIDLGEHRLKDLTHPVGTVPSSEIDGLSSEFPRVRSLGVATNLLSEATSSVGRERERVRRQGHPHTTGRETADPSPAREAAARPGWVSRWPPTCSTSSSTACSSSRWPH